MNSQCRMTAIKSWRFEEIMLRSKRTGNGGPAGYSPTLTVTSRRAVSPLSHRHPEPVRDNQLDGLRNIFRAL